MRRPGSRGRWKAGGWGVTRAECSAEGKRQALRPRRAHTTAAGGPPVSVEALFDKFKDGGAGRLGKDEYAAFLRGIGEWGKNFYTDAKWGERWPKECEDLEATPALGLDPAAFARLYAKYRASELPADYGRAMGANRPLPDRPPCPPARALPPPGSARAHRR